MNDLFDNNIMDSFAKIAETQRKIQESIAPVMDMQKKIADIMEPVSKSMQCFAASISMQSPGVISLQRTLSEIGNMAMTFRIDDSLLKMANVTSSLSESMRSVIESTSSWFTKQTWPTLDWLNSFDYSPLYETLRKLADGVDLVNQFSRLNEIYQQALYESKWFPYPGWWVNRALLTEIGDIISTSRGASKRRERRIDKAILGYYTDAEMKRIKSSWRKSDLDPVIRKTLCQAIDAYIRGEYALTIACLATMWDGLIYIKANNVLAEERQRRRPEKTREEFRELIEYNAFEMIPSDYFDNFITSQCNKVDEVVEGVPNRNGVAHGWYRKYPNKKAAINAILLTDFIVTLYPIEKSEECSNG